MAQKKDLRVYPAFIARDGNGFGVSFPDLPGCLTCADTPEEALANAKEALEGFIYFSEKDGDVLPAPTPFEKLSAPKGASVALISARMDLVRAQQENISVTKSITLPAWLNKIAMEAKVNFSQVLQEALKRKLQVQ